MNTKTTFKKSVLSFVVISALTGAFISWENYLPRGESQQIKDAFQHRRASLESIVTQHNGQIDSEALAQIAQQSLTAKLDAQLDEQIALDAQAFIAQSDEIEHDESGEAYVMNEQVDTSMLAPEAQTIASTADKPMPVSEQVDASILAPEAQTTASTADKPMPVTEQEPLYMMVSPVLFAFDSTEINPNYYEALNDSARFIQRQAKSRDAIWQVVGYADPSGNALYNLKLAKKRAQQVAAYLVDKGVDEAQLSIVSLGASYPMNSERSIANNRSERRVEIHRYQAKISAQAKQSLQQFALPLNNTQAPQKDISQQSITERELDGEMLKSVHNVQQQAHQNNPFKRFTTAMEL